jgi:RNA polymerase sigma-70 factor (ECF subfamily)
VEARGEELLGKLGGFRDNLLILAKTLLDPGLQHKLDASDIVQQTLIVAVAHFDQFAGGDSAQLFAWLKTILKNQLKNALRYLHQEQRNIRRERSLHERLELSWQRLEEGVPGKEPTPLDVVLHNERLLSLTSAINQLPAEERQVVELICIHEWPQSRVAHFLGVSRHVVARRYCKAILQLHQLLPNLE